MNREYIKKIIEIALREDIKDKDITSELILPDNLKTKAFIISKEKGIICGLKIAKLVFQCVDKEIVFESLIKEGSEIYPGQKIAKIFGNAKKILLAERTALNFLQHLSGIATLTRKFVDKVKFYNVEIFDTRKTLPGLRILEKYAVRVGGGKNHRFNLSDQILIKGNHIDLVGLENAIKRAKKSKKPLEVEVRDLRELEKILDLNLKIDVIMLDNMKTNEIKRAIKMIKKRAKIEVSGRVNLNNVKEIAKLGVDRISVGKITHSSKAIDISLKIEKLN